MKDRILQVVKEFLEKKDIQGPLLLGFSGGTDSLALLHLLLESRRFIPFELHVAHVDHGWREESGKEAQMLQKNVEKLKCPFHLHRLKNCFSEEKAREGRLNFFSSLYKKWGCQALLLAHHGDDQSETVLKRVLEGAHLFALGGIKPETALHGMTLWRPLLGVSKKELKKWLDARSLKPLEDPTSFDLRSRMRKYIIPDLQKQFGKEIASNLQKLGKTAQDLGDYLEKKLGPYFEAVQNGSIDLSPFYPFEKVEVKAFLKKWTDQEGAFLSHAALETLYTLLESGASRRKLLSKEKILEIHRRTIAIKN